MWASLQLPRFCFGIAYDAKVRIKLLGHGGRDIKRQALELYADWEDVRQEFERFQGIALPTGKRGWQDDPVQLIPRVRLPVKWRRLNSPYAEPGPSGFSPDFGITGSRGQPSEINPITAGARASSVGVQQPRRISFAGDTSGPAPSGSAYTKKASRNHNWRVSNASNSPDEPQRPAKISQGDRYVQGDPAQSANGEDSDEEEDPSELIISPEARKRNLAARRAGQGFGRQLERDNVGQRTSIGQWLTSLLGNWSSSSESSGRSSTESQRLDGGTGEQRPINEQDTRQPDPPIDPTQPVLRIRGQLHYTSAGTQVMIPSVELLPVGQAPPRSAPAEFLQAQNALEEAERSVKFVSSLRGDAPEFYPRDMAQSSMIRESAHDFGEGLRVPDEGQPEATAEGSDEAERDSPESSSEDSPDGRLMASPEDSPEDSSEESPEELDDTAVDDDSPSSNSSSEISSGSPPEPPARDPSVRDKIKVSGVERDVTDLRLDPEQLERIRSQPDRERQDMITHEYKKLALRNRRHSNAREKLLLTIPPNIGGGGSGDVEQSEERRRSSLISPMDTTATGSVGLLAPDQTAAVSRAALGYRKDRLNLGRTTRHPPDSQGEASQEHQGVQETPTTAAVTRASLGYRRERASQRRLSLPTPAGSTELRQAGEHAEDRLERRQAGLPPRRVSFSNVEERIGDSSPPSHGRDSAAGTTILDAQGNQNLSSEMMTSGPKGKGRSQDGEHRQRDSRGGRDGTAA